MVDEMVTVSKMINATINVTVSHTLNERICGLSGNIINLQALKWQSWVISTKILLIHKYDTFPHKTSCQNTILYWQLTQIFMKLMFLTNPIRLTMVENYNTDVQEAISSSYGPHNGDWVWTNKCNVTWWECNGEKFSSWLKVFTQGALHIRSNWLLGLPTAFMF